MNRSIKVLIFLAATAPFTFAVTCEDTFGVCEAGCFNQDNTLLPDGRSQCVPTRPGFYSPSNSNLEHPCPAGRFSADHGAASCDLCPAGTSGASIALSICSLCPSGSYQDLEGQATCNDCVPGYAGEGADSFVFNIVTNNLECARTMMAPSSSPVPNSMPTTSTVSPTAPSSIESSPSSSVPTIDGSSLSSRPNQPPSASLSTSPTSSPSKKVEHSISPSSHPTVLTSSEHPAPSEKFSQTMIFFLFGIGVVVAAVVITCCCRSCQPRAELPDNDENLPVATVVAINAQGAKVVDADRDVEECVENKHSGENDGAFVEVDLNDDETFVVQKHIGEVGKGKKKNERFRNRATVPGVTFVRNV